MRTYDFSPLYRSAVGFDRLARQLESAARSSQENGWPPYNIETTGENAYRIEIAVAGFTPDELNIEAKENQLTVTGHTSDWEFERLNNAVYERLMSTYSSAEVGSVHAVHSLMD